MKVKGFELFIGFELALLVLNGISEKIFPIGIAGSIE
jgi:hypothetical protein